MAQKHAKPESLSRVIAGNNIFNSENGFAINYNNGFQMIIDKRVVIYNELEEGITKIFDFTNDISLKQNIKNDIESIKIEQYKYKIQSFIQTYNNRMIDNK